MLIQVKLISKKWVLSMKKIFVTLCLMLMAGLYSYVVAEKINRQIIETETLKNNLDIAIEKLKLDNAKQEHNKALSGFFPNVSLLGKYLRHLSNNKYDYFCGLNVSFTIFDGFSRYNYIREKVAEVKIKEASYNRAVAKAIYESNEIYIRLMSEYENRELLYEIRKRTEKNRDIVKLKYNSGLTDITDLKRVELDILGIDCDLEIVKRNIALFSERLLKSMGRNDDTVLLETDERVDIYYNNKKLPSEPNYCDIIVSMPEFLTAQYNFDGHKAQQARIKGQKRWPLSNFSSQYGTGKDGKVNKNLEVNMNYTIFSGGEISSDVKIASNNLEIASRELKSKFDSLRLEAKRYYNDLIRAWEDVNIKEQYVNVLKLKAEISSKKYANGFSRHEDWYSIENSYIGLQKELLKAKKDVALKLVMWEIFICLEIKDR
ncbi:MAG: hypothetical protein Nk1A_4540 [Endomicrobiia bacterium]|nr:MAG: hypothetical protein Nk1A_4540 [Endomicrobiia bacterium]